MVRFQARGAVCLALATLGCHPPAGRTAGDNGLPPECQRSFGKGPAAGFGAMGAANSKNGRNYALEAMDRNCDLALEEQRERHRRQEANEALELQRQHLELQRQQLEELRRLQRQEAEQRARLESDRERQRASASASTAAPPSVDARRRSGDAKILIFGGTKHDVYLGCLCDDNVSDSVFNQYGEFGSEFSNTSVNNHFSPYGSPFGDLSMCNKFAQHPPVIVNSDGKYFGSVTSNTAFVDAIAWPAVVEWMARVCAK